MDENKEALKAEQRKQVQKEIMSLSTAILAGSVIVGVSVLIAANLMIAKLGAGTSPLKAVEQAKREEAEIVKVATREDAPQKGTGKVVIEEFSDFQCPFCQSFWQGSYKDIIKNYVDTGKVTFIYRHFPLQIHDSAQKAAEAAECAYAQGKFWDYHDVLFKNSKSDGGGLGITDLKEYAKDLNLDTSKFNSCLDDSDMKKIVENDLNAGLDADISGTPTFFINGRRVVGALPFSGFKKIIDEELSK